MVKTKSIVELTLKWSNLNDLLEKEMPPHWEAFFLSSVDVQIYFLKRN